MMENIVLKSRHKQEKEARDLEIYEKFVELMKIPGAQVLQVNTELMRIFPGIYSPATIWAIRKRVAKRLGVKAPKKKSKKTKKSN